MKKRDASGTSCTLEEARAAKESARAVFERLAGAVAIGVTRSGKGYGLKVNLPRSLPSDVTAPKEINGVPLRIEVVGPIRKRAA